MEFEDIPSILVFNKVDQADVETDRQLLGKPFLEVPLVSAKNAEETSASYSSI